jgi:hypothetical protein
MDKYSKEYIEGLDDRRNRAIATAILIGIISSILVLFNVPTPYVVVSIMIGVSTLVYVWTLVRAKASVIKYFEKKDSVDG